MSAAAAPASASKSEDNPFDGLFDPPPDPPAATPPAADPAPPAATPPAEPAPPAAPPAKKEIKDFEPVGFEESQNQPEPDPEPGPTPEPKTREEKKVETGNIREQFVASQARVAELEQEKKDLAARLEAATGKEKELTGQLDETRDNLTHLQKTGQAIDPQSAPEVKELQNQFNKKVTDYATDMNALGREGSRFATDLPGLISDLRAAGDTSAEGYQDRMAALQDKLGGYGSDPAHVLTFVREAMGIEDRVLSKMREIQEDAIGYQYRTEKGNYDTMRRGMDDVIENWWHVDDNLRQSDPYNPLVFFDEMRRVNSEFDAQLKKFEDFGRAALLPTEPIDPKRLAMMTDEERRNLVQGQNQRTVQAIAQLNGRLGPMMAAYTTLPGLIKRNKELAAELKKYQDQIPDPDTSTPHTPESAKSIDEFEPSNPHL